MLSSNKNIDPKVADRQNLTIPIPVEPFVNLLKQRLSNEEFLIALD